MGLDALLAKLQREAVTPVTPSIALGVTAEALPLLGVPPVSPVPPEDKDGQPFYAGWWLLHFSDRDPLEVAFSPAATHAEVLDAYPDAAAAEPIEAGRRQPDTLLAGNQEAAVSAWLAQIGETDPATIAEVLTACRRAEKARDYFLQRSGYSPGGGTTTCADCQYMRCVFHTKLDSDSTANWTVIPRQTGQ